MASEAWAVVRGIVIAADGEQKRQGKKQKEGPSG
jgi:hypothetical protein